MAIECEKGAPVHNTLLRRLVTYSIAKKLRGCVSYFSHGVGRDQDRAGGGSHWSRIGYTEDF